MKLNPGAVAPTGCNYAELERRRLTAFASVLKNEKDIEEEEKKKKRKMFS